MLMREEIMGEMPPDKVFIEDDGRQVPCRATGFEVFITATGQWMNEYEDSEGNIYYC